MGRTLFDCECPPRDFKNEGKEGWFYAGVGHFVFVSQCKETHQCQIKVPTKMLRKALVEIDKALAQGGEGEGK